MKDHSQTWKGEHGTPVGCVSPCKSPPLVNAFVEETGVELIELDITACLGQLPEEVLHQKDEGPFTDIILYLDELV